MDFNVETLKIEDYDEIKDLWMQIHGFGIRSIDDSREGVQRFLDRNPGISVVAKSDGKVVGTILCGHDGRTASFYHVCVHEDYRRHGIAKAMVVQCMNRLKEEKINKISLVAFSDNELGNGFWQHECWKRRQDVNVYDFILNEENITRFNG